MGNSTFLGLDLPTCWYILLTVIFTVYWILDSISSGPGIFHMLLSAGESRKKAVNIPGPLRFTNEVWMIIGAAAVLGVFPKAYSVILSGFYIPIILWCLCLIIRKISPEFRSAVNKNRWRMLWDISYSVSSVFSILIAGLIAGNLITGIPLDQNLRISRGLFFWLSPYPAAVAFSLFIITGLHGALFFTLKTQESLYSASSKAAKLFSGLSIVTIPALYMFSIRYIPDLRDTITSRPYIIVIAGAAGLNLILLFFKVKKRAFLWAYWLSCLNIFLIAAVSAGIVYPAVALSTIHPDYSLTIYNAASQESSQSVLLSTALSMLPLICLFTIISHWTFKGKIRLDENSY